MSVEESTSKTLRFSVYISIAVIILGLAAYFLNMGQNILWFGILLLIVSPLIGVIVTTIGLIREKDMKWVKVAIILIVIAIIGMLVKISF